MAGIDLSTMFEDQSAISGAKNFEQSQPVQPTVFDEPQAFQEFSEVEHELEQHNQQVSELSEMADNLQNRQAVNRQDRLALESMISQLEGVPPAGAYTRDNSMVNYQVTLETVWSNIVKAAVAVKKQIIKFMNMVTKFIKQKFNEMFVKPYYDEMAKHAARRQQSYANKAAQQNKQATDLQTAMQQGGAAQQSSTPPASSPQPPTQQGSTNPTPPATPVAANVVNVDKIHYDIRQLLKGKYLYLESITTKKQDLTNIKQLLWEMLNYRLDARKSKLIASIYNNDAELIGSVKASLDILRHSDDLYQRGLDFIDAVSDLKSVDDLSDTVKNMNGSVIADQINPTSLRTIAKYIKVDINKIGPWGLAREYNNNINALNTASSRFGYLDSEDAFTFDWVDSELYDPSLSPKDVARIVNKMDDFKDNPFTFNDQQLYMTVSNKFNILKNDYEMMRNYAVAVCTVYKKLFYLDETVKDILEDRQKVIDLVAANYNIQW